MFPINMLWQVSKTVEKEVPVYNINYLTDEGGTNPVALIWDTDTEFWAVVPMYELKPIKKTNILTE